MKARVMLNQSQFAKRIGISRAMVGRYVRDGVLSRALFEDLTGRLWIDLELGRMELEGHLGHSNNPTGSAAPYCWGEPGRR